MGFAYRVGRTFLSANGFCVITKGTDKTLNNPASSVVKAFSELRRVPSELPGQLAQEFVFIHFVFEGLASVDEHYRNLVGELAAELFVGVHVDLLPSEAATAMQFGQRLLHDLAQMTPAS